MKVRVEMLDSGGFLYSTTRAMIPGMPEEFFGDGDEWFRVTVEPPDVYAEALRESLG